MRTVLGIDGGGTKTLALVVEETGRVIGHGRLDGPTNDRLITVAGQSRIVEQIIEQAVAGINPPPRFAAARIFFPSGGTPFRTVLDVPALRDQFESIDDCWGVECSIAATGAFGKRYQDHHVVTIISGTGSCGRIQTKEGKELYAGGWGEQLGDEGSGFIIAQRGLRAALHAHDGITEPTLLLKKMTDFFSLAEPAEIGSLAYRPGELPREELAAFCPQVFAAAAEGDAIATTLLREEAEWLAQLVQTLIRRAEITGAPVSVVPTGSVWKGGGIFTKTFANRLAKTAPTATIIQPRFEPVVGAVIEALHALHGSEEAAILARLADTLPEL